LDMAATKMTHFSLSIRSLRAFIDSTTEGFRPQKLSHNSVLIVIPFDFLARRLGKRFADRWHTNYINFISRDKSYRRKGSADWQINPEIYFYTLTRMIRQSKVE
jgi:hypothetical protein